MLTLSVAGVPGAVELGLIEHVGARVGEGVTEQVRATVALNPAAAGTTFTVEVDGAAPGLTVTRRQRGSGEREVRVQLNVAPTDSAELMVQVADARTGAGSAPADEAGSRQRLRP